MAPGPACPRCGEPLGLDEAGDRLCPRCLLAVALDVDGDSREPYGPPASRPSASETASRRGAAPPHPSHVGPYRVIGVLGSGGMGVVYLAEQTQPVKRRVALKLVRPGLDTELVLRRFDAERQALALMTHRGITRILDAGADEAGRPYFVMELVEGVPITQYCDERRLTASARLALFMDLCAAVQHAHDKGVIHRDLKPSNILVIEEDGRAVPKVIDFGVAKAIDQRLTEATMFTELGVIVGTPEYMSPEQADARVADVDARTDVYTLGVVLYELLVGAQPFDAAALRRAGLDEIRRVIRDVDPPTPSARLTALGAAAGDEIARRRRTDASALRRLLRGELDCVCLKALEKDRARRYGSALDLADDVRRSLRGEPVKARPPALRYRLRKYCRRHRAALAAAAAMVAAVTLGLAAGAALLSEPVVPSADVQVVTRSSVMGIRAIVSADGRRVAFSEWNAIRQNWSLWVADSVTGSTEAIHDPADDTVEVSPVQWSRDGRHLYFMSEQRAGPAYLERLSLPDRRTQRLGSFSPTRWPTISPDERWIASVRVDSTAHRSVLVVSRLDGSEERRVAARSLDEPYFALAWSPDGTSVACSVGHLGLVGTPMHLVRVDLADGRESRLGRDDWLAVMAKVWLPDASGLLVLGHKWGDPKVKANASLWRVDASSGRSWPIGNGPDQLSPWYMDLSADGTTLAAVRTRLAANVWVLPGDDPALARRIAPAWEGPRFFPDGGLLFTGMDQTLWRTNADGSGQTRIGEGFHTAVSPDGRYLVYSSVLHADRTQIWRADADGRNAVRLTDGAAAKKPDVSPDGKWVVYNTAADAALWKVPLAGGAAVRLAEGFADAPSISPDSRWVAVRHRQAAGGPIVPALISMDGGGIARTFSLPPRTELWHLRFARDGQAIDVALGLGVGAGNLWRIPLDGSPPRQLTHFASEELSSFDWSWDGKTLACLRGGWRGEVVLLRGGW